MTVIHDDSTRDKYGKYPIVFKGVKSLREVNEYLWQHYNGYKFAILFDETKDEYEDYGTAILVYFLDEIVDEAAEYANVKIVRKQEDIWVVSYAFSGCMVHNDKFYTEEKAREFYEKKKDLPYCEMFKTKDI